VKVEHGMCKNAASWRLLLTVLVAGGCASTPTGPDGRLGSRVGDEVRDDLREDDGPRILPETHFAAGQLFERQGFYNKALAQYRRATLLNHDYDEAYGRLGLLHSLMGQRDQAVAALRRAVELRPAHAVYLNNLGFELALQGRWEESRGFLQRAVHIEPQFARAHVNLGMVLCRLGRFDEALTTFQQAVPQADAFYNVGLMYRAQDRYAEAVDTFRYVLALDAQFTAAQRQLDELEPQLGLPEPQVADPGALTAATWGPMNRAAFLAMHGQPTGNEGISTPRQRFWPGAARFFAAHGGGQVESPSDRRTQAATMFQGDSPTQQPTTVLPDQMPVTDAASIPVEPTEPLESGGTFDAPLGADHRRPTSPFTPPVTDLATIFELEQRMTAAGADAPDSMKQTDPSLATLEGEPFLNRYFGPPTTAAELPPQPSPHDRPTMGGTVFPELLGRTSPFHSPGEWPDTNRNLREHQQNLDEVRNEIRCLEEELMEIEEPCESFLEPEAGAEDFSDAPFRDRTSSSDAAPAGTTPTRSERSQQGRRGARGHGSAVQPESMRNHKSNEGP
jgi:Tfp pilus assembly protein PilF